MIKDEDDDVDDNDLRRVATIVNAVRLTAGYAAHYPDATLSQDEYQKMYDDLCELSELLGIPQLTVDQEK
jgi:hypothetical protein